MKTLSISPVVLAAAATSIAGIVLVVPIDEARAGPRGGKGGSGSKSLTWEATKPPGSKVVRDHRRERQVRPSPQGPRPGSRGCARWPSTPSCHPIVRDHRGPRVVPKEDPPQKW